ncbi:DUF1642 domain-containing protein [Lactiplantibacillus argentoratensis]|uniref:DUF1642 domain-containing protein n=1 Tax=Lactiplantibacillus argentoratensis TaxID=271881 RepID=UPI001AF2C6D0|nr:DUF1642 domain-containing protein [Lactiplantibacillus argentoratensis]MCB7463405.1 DUF1642 domain-containing protein [Lactiplantibacillus argentoratensis]QSE53236.1 DUF1642 domain-containing protein [Lactiplantibacillus plantarum]
MKFYRKQPIEAEQFDGSSDLFIKYDMIDIGTMCEERHSPEIYMSGINKKVSVGDWIITDNFNHHTLMTDEEFKQQYAGLPVIPKNVANYLTDCKLANTTIETSLSGNIMLFSRARSHDMIHDILSWLCPSDNQDLFARAWLDGYKVEADK